MHNKSVFLSKKLNTFRLIQLLIELYYIGSCTTMGSYYIFLNEHHDYAAIQNEIDAGLHVKKYFSNVFICF